MLLGVNGICIIAHGASTPLAIKTALRVSAESIEVGDAIFKWLKHELTKNAKRMAGAYLARNAFRAIKKKAHIEK